MKAPSIQSLWLQSEAKLLLPSAPPIRASGHEIMRVLLKALGAEVRENMGTAMAALMLNKPRAEVTPSEAINALHDALKIPDAVQRARVIREGDRAMLATLSPEIVPEAYAGDLVSAFMRLDDGETDDLGVLTPSPTSRRDPGAAQARERAFSTEVAFQMGGHKTSRDKAVQIASGVGRGNWNWTQPPTLPWAADFTVLQRAVDAGWRNNRRLKEEAMAEGAKIYCGKEPDPKFLAYRRLYLTEWGGRGAPAEKL